MAWSFSEQDLSPRRDFGGIDRRPIGRPMTDAVLMD
jgi:hypothetical protein